MKIRTAVFPVGRRNLEFLPASKAVPMELLPVVDRPLIQYALDEATAAGIERFIFVTSPAQRAIARYLSPSTGLTRSLRGSGNIALLEAIEAAEMPANAIEIVEHGECCGPVRAILAARGAIGDEPFAVLMPDDLVLADRPPLAQMVREYPMARPNLVGLASRSGTETNDVWRVRIEDRKGRPGCVRPFARGGTETAEPDWPTVTGRYILDPSVLDNLQRVPTGADDKMSFLECVLAGAGERGLHGFQIDGEYFDCSAKPGFLEASVAVGLQRSLGPAFRATVARRLAIYDRQETIRGSGARLPGPERQTAA